MPSFCSCEDLTQGIIYDRQVLFELHLQPLPEKKIILTHIIDFKDLMPPCLTNVWLDSHLELRPWWTEL